MWKPGAQTASSAVFSKLHSILPFFRNHDRSDSAAKGRYCVVDVIQKLEAFHLENIDVPNLDENREDAEEKEY